MDAAVQAQQTNVQQAAGYYRTQAGGGGLTAVQGVETAQDPFGAILAQLLNSGMQPQDTQEELLRALEEQMDESDPDAAMQMLAQLFAAQPSLVQQVDPQLLAQLTGQTPQALVEGQQANALQQLLTTTLTTPQTAQPDATVQQGSQDPRLFADALVRQTGMEVVQTVPVQGEAQNASLLGEAGYQRALYQAQQQLDGAGKTTGTLTEDAAMQPKNDKQAQSTNAIAPVTVQTGMLASETGTAQVVQQTANDDLQSLLAQVKTGLMDGASKGDKNFVIRLKPEGLGEITVRMVEQGGKITMDIFASSQQTQRLLSSEIVNLRQAMEPYNVVVNAQQSDGGSTSFSLEQQMHQGFEQQQQSRQQSNDFYFANDEAQDDTASLAAQYAQMASGLDVYT